MMRETDRGRWGRQVGGRLTRGSGAPSASGSLGVEHRDRAVNTVGVQPPGGQQLRPGRSRARRPRARRP